MSESFNSCDRARFSWVFCNWFIRNNSLRAYSSAVTTRARFNNFFRVFKSGIVVNFTTSFSFVRQGVLPAIRTVLPKSIFLKLFNPTVDCKNLFNKRDDFLGGVKCGFEKFNHNRILSRGF